MLHAYSTYRLRGKGNYIDHSVYQAIISDAPNLTFAAPKKKRPRQNEVVDYNPVSSINCVFN